jgi:hypothetical protein
MGNVDPAFEQLVFNVPKAERERHIHHYDQTDSFGSRVKAERVIRFAHPPDLLPPYRQF